MYRDVEDRQPGIIAQADDFWSDLSPEDREVVTRYTASDEFELNRASRGIADMTNERSAEMDKLSSVLGQSAEIYRWGSLPCDQSDNKRAVQGFNG